jgi:hypothetical protein
LEMLFLQDRNVSGHPPEALLQASLSHSVSQFKYYSFCLPLGRIPRDTLHPQTSAYFLKNVTIVATLDNLHKAHSPCFCNILNCSFSPSFSGPNVFLLTFFYGTRNMIKNLRNKPIGRRDSQHFFGCETYYQEPMVASWTSSQLLPIPSQV